MNKFEYIVLDNCIDDEPTKESVLEQIEERSWTDFESLYYNNEFAVREIVKEWHSAWDIYDEDDGVYIVIRKSGEEDFKVYKAIIFQTIGVNTNCIYNEDNFREKNYD